MAGVELFYTIAKVAIVSVMTKLWAGYDLPRNCPDLTNKRSRKAVGEAVGNAKRDRRERNAFSVAVAVALCGSLAVNVVRAVGGVCGRQRWPSALAVWVGVS